MSTWTYHTFHSYRTNKGEQVNCTTQLYQIGIYLIVNNDPGMQATTTPTNMVKLEKNLKQREKKGEISELVFGPEITVSDVTGFFEEVKT